MIAYFSSERATSARTILESGVPWRFVEDSYKRTRNFVLVCLMQPHACRAGAVESLTLRDVDRMRRQDDRHYVMFIASHKTGEIHDACTLILSEEDRNYLRLYLPHQRLHPIATCTDEDALFVTIKTGKPMNSSNLSEALTTEFSHIGHEHRVTCTAYRQLATTTTFDEQPTLLPAIATLMNHSERTQRTYYVLDEKVSTYFFYMQYFLKIFFATISC